MFISAYQGEGTSTIAREYARVEAAMASRPVWLIDADLRQQSQLRAMADEPHRFGKPGPLSQATPDGSMFFEVTPSARDRNNKPVPAAKYLVARPFFENKLWVTRFREQNLDPGQKVFVEPQTSYWKALRRHAQTIVVDAPAMECAQSGLGLCAHMDAVIMVVSEDTGDMAHRQRLKNHIERNGGRVLGLFYNKARHPNNRFSGVRVTA